MHITDIFQASSPTFSFEFFPPKTPESSDRLYNAIRELEPLKPSFVSVTYGAGGSTRDLTHDLVVRARKELSVTTIPHLTCVCHQQADIQAILERYAEHDICNILALGGDPPLNLVGYDKANDAFQQAADLVRFIKDFKNTHLDKNSGGRGFGIGVAGFPEGHPGTPNRLTEMDYLKQKVDAGADYICTQLFFDNHDFYDFRERCQLAGINIPIVAGIMPIVSAKGMNRMAELSAGSRFPAPLLRSIQRAGEDTDAVKRVGIHWATEQCRDLLDHHVAGIHFYTLNQSNATRQIFQNLGARDSAALRQ